MSRSSIAITVRPGYRTRGATPPGRLVLLRLGSLLAIAMLVVGLTVLSLGAAVGKISSAIARYTDVKIPKIPVGPQTTFVYDRRGRLVTTLHDEYNRTVVPLPKISADFRNAVIAIEDKDFYRHGALDAVAIMRAAYENAVSGRIEQGGSTITQQLVKNLFTGGKRTLERKIHEAVLAMQLERKYSKNQILQMYLNTVYFGHGAYGAEAAAQTYFGVPADDLGALRSATLAGLVAAPGRFDPVRHRKPALARRNVVLEKMAQEGYLTLARAAHLETRPLKLPGLHQPDGSPYPYFTQYVTKRVLKLTGYDRTFEGGLRVATTLDQVDQRAAERAIATHLPGRHDPSAALVAIDPSTGYIRALVGGRNFEKQKFNLAVQAHRQTGSAAKMFTLAAAMEQKVSLKSIWNGPPHITIDDPRCLDPQTGKPWEVSNYADESAGTMTLKDAIANSVNTIFSQLVLDVGPENVADVAHRLGIRTKLEDVCSITLGSQAVTPLDMAASYATLAARGIHHTPQVVTSIRDASGKLVWKAKPKGNRAIAENDADLVTYALQGVVQYGTGTAAEIGRPVAGKTGTGQDYRDAWFCGYTPQLAACVWVGYRRGEIPMHNVEGIPNVFGGSIPAGIWHDFMATAMRGKPVEDFAFPSFEGYDVNPDHSITLPPPPPPKPSPTKSKKPSPEPSKCPNPKKCPGPSPTGQNSGPGDGLAGMAFPIGGALGLAALSAMGRRRRGHRRHPVPHAYRGRHRRGP